MFFRNLGLNYQFNESIEIPQSANAAYRPLDFKPDFNANISNDNKSFRLPITSSEYPLEFMNRTVVPQTSLSNNRNIIQSTTPSYPQPIYTSYDYRPFGEHNLSPIYVIREPATIDLKKENVEQIKRSVPALPVNQLGIAEDHKIRVLSDEIERQRGINISTYIKFNELKGEKVELRNELVKIENEIDSELKKSKNNETEILKKILEDKNRELAFLIESRSKLTNDELNSLIWKVKEKEIENGHLRERTAQLNQARDILLEDFGNSRNERHLARNN